MSADGSSQSFGGLTAQIGWFGLRIGGHPALSLHSSNEPGELSQWLCHDDSTINIVVVIIIIIIIIKNVRVFQVGTSCRSPQSLSHCASGCRAECSLAWGHSGWCWVLATQGTWEPCTAAGQTSASSWERRRGSWCCVAGRTGCRTAARRRDTGESGTWSDASTSLNQQQPSPVTSQ